MLTTKQLGIGVMAVSVMLMILGLLYISQTESFILGEAKVGPNGECVHDGTICPYEQLNKLAVPKYIGAFFLVLVFAGGMYLFLKRTPQEKSAAGAKKAAKGLGAEEAKVFELVSQNNGMLFQNELVDKMQISKVKVTRLLDKLEAKGLVERRRRGMTNIIILKQ